MLMGTFKAIINHLFKENFDTTFMRNKKKTKIFLKWFITFPLIL